MLLYVLCIGAVAASMIQLHDKNFDQEDTQLTRLLKERMKGHYGDPDDIPWTYDPQLNKQFVERMDYTNQILEMEGMRVMTGSNGTRRQGVEPVKSALATNVTGKTRGDPKMKFLFGMFAHQQQNKSARRQANSDRPNDPEAHHLLDRIIESQQHQLYLTQYRLRDLQRIVDKYSGNINYRMGYIYCRLETLLNEMHIMHTYTKNNIFDMRFYYHMFYYFHMMKRDIDITYIVEHMIELHTKHMETKYKTLSFTPPPSVFTNGSKQDIPRLEDIDPDTLKRLSSEIREDSSEEMPGPRPATVSQDKPPPPGKQ